MRSDRGKTVTRFSTLHRADGGAVEGDVACVEGFRGWIWWKREGEVCEWEGGVGLEGLGVVWLACEEVDEGSPGFGAWLVHVFYGEELEVAV